MTCILDGEKIDIDFTLVQISSNSKYRSVSALHRTCIESLLEMNDFIDMILIQLILALYIQQY